jgi:hypothetical protein
MPLGLLALATRRANKAANVCYWQILLQKSAMTDRGLARTS